MRDPDQQDETKHRFPLELVAKYAVDFLWRKLDVGSGPAMPLLSDLDRWNAQDGQIFAKQEFDKAAELSLLFLDACQHHLDLDRDNNSPALLEARHRRNFERELELVRDKYPEGASWIEISLYNW